MKTRLIALAAAFLLVTSAPTRAAEALNCRASAPREKVRVAKIGQKLDILLADGRLVYFPTLEPPRATSAAPDRPRYVAAQLTSLLAGRDLEMEKLGGPDRWGRIPVKLFVPGSSESVDVTLAAAGLVMAGIGAGGCGAQVRAAEAEARAASLGVWADPDFAVLDADRPESFARRAGTLALVEGRVTSIGHTRWRTYLNFGPGRRDFSLTIARRRLKEFARANLSPQKLLHKFLRARGVVEMRAGPQIELFHPDQIEFIEDKR